MSDFGVFEAATDAEQAPRRRERIAARQMSGALAEIHSKFDRFLGNADGPDGFEDRWLMSKKDILRILQANQVGAYPAVVREVHGSLKSAWYARQSAAEGFAEPKNDKDRDLTINDRQKAKIDKGDKSVSDEVKTNTGDGSDAEGNRDDNEADSDHGKPNEHGERKNARRRYAGDDDDFDEEAGDTLDSDFTEGGDSGSDRPSKNARRRQACYPGCDKDEEHSKKYHKDDKSEEKEARRRRGVFEDQTHPNQNLQPGREVSDGPLIPDAYNDPSNPETGAVQNDFTPGGDTGADSRREAMQLVADLYTDWAQGNNLRVASMNTLDYYAASGLHDDDYYLLAGMIRRAECDCDDDDDKDDSPPPSDSDSEDSDDGDSDDSETSSDDSESDSDSDDSDSGGESDSGDNPFAEGGGDDSEPSDDAGDSSGGENPFGGEDTAIDDSEDSGGEVPPDDGGAPPVDPGADPSAAGPPDVAGQSFEIPQTPPELSPEMQGQIPPDDTQGTEALPPEVIDEILGLPPGTLEQLVMEELSGGGGAPPSGPPPGGPPPQLAARRRRAAEDPTQAAGADPAAAAQPQMPAAPPAGAGSAGTIPPPGSASVAPPPPAMPLENQPAEDALLDTAVQAVTQMVDKETQEYQQIIDPLTKALQAIQFAQQVEQAENPLDVTPPEGTVNTDPSTAPGGTDSSTPPKAARKNAGGGWNMAGRIAQIADRYNLTHTGQAMLHEAMSRKHYEHVGEAIRTLPPELRGGIANHIGGMFSEDNPRFNHDKWLASVGVTAGRIAGNPRDRAGDSWAESKDKGDREHEDYDTDPDNWEDRTASRRQAGDADAGLDSEHRDDNGACTQCGYHSGHSEDCKWSRTASRRPFVIRSRTRNGGRTAGENLKNTPTLDAFEFPGQGDQVNKPSITDNNKLTDLPKMKGAAYRQAKGILDMYDAWTKQRSDQGLNMGDATNVDAFKEEKGPKLGPKQVNTLEKTFKANRRSASFFNRRVPGWKWDDHLAGYTSKDARSFTCSCGNEFETPSYGTCRCGKLWNSYAIGDGQHLASDSALMFITREIPIRDDVIVANRQLIADDRGYENFDPYGKGDTDWVEDADREDADAPHAPGKTATLQSPGQQFEDLQQEPSLKDLVRQHLLDKMSAQDFFADKVTDVNDSWVKYDDDDPSRAGGPKKPPSTKLQGGDPKWHSRAPAGQFKSTTPFK